MRETELFQKFQPHLSKWGAYDRVENALGSGMSDVFYNIGGSVGWVETKVAKGDWIYFEKFQPNWINKHLRQGFRRMFILVMDKHETIHLWRAHQVLDVPRVPYEKWQCVNVNDLPRAVVEMYKPYRFWGLIKDELCS